VTIGTFDGMHLGHQALLKRTAQLASVHKVQSVALTFELPPQNYLGRPKQLILPPARKIEQLHQLVERVVLIDFPEIQPLSPEDFARQILCERLRAIAVVVGTNYRFGRDQQGDVKRLQVLGQALGFRVEVIPPVLIDGHTVSSTAIREALARGDIGQATRLLGYAPHFWGRVERGAGRGRTLGVPTANLVIDPRLVTPEQGIFAARVFYKRWWDAALYIGDRPSFAHDGQRSSVEVHLLDFQGDLYGQELEVEVLQKMRDDQRFGTIEALVGQITEDLAKIRRLLRDRKATVIEDLTQNMA
jgi:riboflavin kinase/FMN adenylyltransferase